MSDQIERQAAIDAVENTDCELTPSAWDELTDAIMQVPSAQPEIIRCKDCKYRGVGNYCVYGTRLAWVTKSNDFCSKAERRTDDTD